MSDEESEAIESVANCNDELRQAQQIGTAKEKAIWLRNKKLIKKLQQDNIDVEALLGRREDLPPLTCREQLLHALHRPLAQLLLAVLMLLDSVVIVGEIVVEVKKFIAEVHASELLTERIANWMLVHVQMLGDRWNRQQFQVLEPNQTFEFIAFLDKVAENLTTASFCDLGSNESERIDDHKYELYRSHIEQKVHEKEVEMERFEVVIQVLAVTSIVVLGLFVVEVVLKFIAMGPKKFLSSKLEVFDALIILVSFSVDLGTFLNEDPSPEATVMIILLIWRIVRLVNGFLMHEKQTAESHNHIMQKIHKLMIYEVRYLKTVKDLQAEKLNGYRELCKKHQIPQEEMLSVEAISQRLTEDALKSTEKESPQRKSFPRNITLWLGQRSSRRHHSEVAKLDMMVGKGDNVGLDDN